jgi:predicted O-methyltransferase YrrM
VVYIPQNREVILIELKAMSRETINLTPDLYNYVLSVSLREPDILHQLRTETAQHRAAQMQIGPDQGQFMALLVRMLGAKKTLEVGTFTGYSALVVAIALPPDGQVITCDISESDTAIAQRYWQEAGVADKIQLHLAPGLDTLQRLVTEGHSNTFDFAFIDADKQNYPSYYKLALQLVRPGGLIAVDNTLWSGRVLESQTADQQTRAIQAFNQTLHQDQRVRLSLVPIGDGLTLALKL